MSKTLKNAAMVMGMALGAVACGGTAEVDTDVTTVSALDAERYAGKWFEIASYPQEFQDGCSCVAANYRVTPVGIEVRNQCRLGGVNGRPLTVLGRAYRPDESQPGRLKVEFPFLSREPGDYWVFELADDYSHAVVTDPYRSTLWILARGRTMDAATLDGIRGRLRAGGFDLDRLKLSEQEGCPEDR